MNGHARFSRIAATALYCCAAIMAQISVNSHLFAQEIAPEQVQEQSLEDLMAQLRDPTLENWEPIERKIWQKWSASGSDTLDFLLQRGRDALDVGSINDAIGHFSAAIDHDPNFAEAWNQRATAFFFSGQYGPSMNDIQQVLVLNPDHFGALTGMAMILERTDRPAEALDVVYRVLEVHPHRPDVLLAKDRLEKATAGSAL